MAPKWPQRFGLWEHWEAAAYVTLKGDSSSSSCGMMLERLFFKQKIMKGFRNETIKIQQPLLLVEADGLVKEGICDTPKSHYIILRQGCVSQSTFQP